MQLSKATDHLVRRVPTRLAILEELQFRKLKRFQFVTEFNGVIKPVTSCTRGMNSPDEGATLCNWVERLVRLVTLVPSCMIALFPIRVEAFNNALGTKIDDVREATDTIVLMAKRDISRGV